MYIDTALVRAHHAVDHRQPQPRALADQFGGEKGLKNARQRGFGDAGAAVMYADGDVAGAWHQPQAVAQALVVGRQRRFDHHRAALLANGVDGVGTQVQQRLLDLRRVGQDGRHGAVDVQVQLNRRWQGDAQQALGVVQYVGQWHAAAVYRLVAAEGEDLAHQIACAATGFVNLHQALVGGRVGATVGFGQLGVAQNGAQDVVEVVCNTTRHGADGLHFV